MLTWKRPHKFTFLKNVKTIILIFEYFRKIPKVLNSKHPFYPILIPSNPYVKFSFFFVLFVGGSRGPNNLKIFLMISIIISTRVCKKIFLIKAKNKKNTFVRGVPKLLRKKIICMGFLKILWVKGKKPPPPPGPYRVKWLAIQIWTRLLGNTAYVLFIEFRKLSCKTSLNFYLLSEK